MAGARRSSLLVSFLHHLSRDDRLKLTDASFQSNLSVIFSAYSANPNLTPEAIERCRRAGADAVIYPPFNEASATIEQLQQVRSRLPNLRPSQMFRSSSSSPSLYSLADISSCVFRSTYRLYPLIDSTSARSASTLHLLLAPALNLTSTLNPPSILSRISPPRPTPRHHLPFHLSPHYLPLPPLQKSDPPLEPKPYRRRRSRPFSSRRSLQRRRQSL